MAAGKSPYDVEGYVYPPLLALVLASVADEPHLFRVWAALSICALVAAASLVISTEYISGCQRALSTGVAVVTGLSFWPSTTVLFLGQVDLLLLVVVAFAAASLGRPVVAGALIGGLGALKSWPGALLLPLLVGRAVQPRWRVLAGAAVALLTVPVTLLVLDGPSGVTTFLARTFSASDQATVSNSVWGVGESVFTDRFIDPLVNSPALRVGVSSALAGWVLLLVWLILQRPPSALRVWQILAAVVLLLPVSHLAYTVFMLPLLWIAVATACGGERRRILLALGLFVWWLTVRASWGG